MRLYRVYIKDSEDPAEYFRQKAPANVRATEMARKTPRGCLVVLEQVEPKKMPAKDLVLVLLNGDEWLGPSEVLREVLGKEEDEEEEDEEEEASMALVSDTGEKSPCCSAPLKQFENGSSFCCKCLEWVTRPTVSPSPTVGIKESQPVAAEDSPAAAEDCECWGDNAEELADADCPSNQGAGSPDPEPELIEEPPAEVKGEDKVKLVMTASYGMRRADDPRVLAEKKRGFTHKELEW